MQGGIGAALYACIPQRGVEIEVPLNDGHVGNRREDFQKRVDRGVSLCRSVVHVDDREVIALEEIVS